MCLYEPVAPEASGHQAEHKAKTKKGEREALRMQARDDWVRRWVEDCKDDIPWTQKRIKARKAWRELTKEEQAGWIKWFAEELSRNGELKEKKEARIVMCGGLFTWIKRDWVNSHTRKYVVDRLPAGMTGLPPIKLVEDILRESPAMKALLAKFKEFRLEVETKKDTITKEPVLPPKSKRSWKMELCPLSYQKGMLMVHFHEYDSADGQNIYADPAAWTFDGVAPHVARCTARTAGRTRAWAQGHYYGGTAPKIGTLFMGSNFKGHLQFPVNPLWPRALWATEKMTATAYRGELVKCKVDVERHSKNVDYQLTLENSELLESEKRKVRKLVRQRYTPLRVYKKVEDEWRPQYHEIKGRYKTLVILGDSEGGKSSWAILQGKEHLDDEEDTMFLVDCANTVSPNLNGWDYFSFKGMVFDEGTPELMLQEKKLFQAGMFECLLSQSTCNQYAYKIYNWRKMMIITTNKWDLKKLDPADRDWIKKNTVLLDLTDGTNHPKMFLQPGELAEEQGAHGGLGLHLDEVTEEQQDDLERDLEIIMGMDDQANLHHVMGMAN